MSNGEWGRWSSPAGGTFPNQRLICLQHSFPLPPGSATPFWSRLHVCPSLLPILHERSPLKIAPRVESLAPSPSSHHCSVPSVGPLPAWVPLEGLSFTHPVRAPRWNSVNICQMVELRYLPCPQRTPPQASDNPIPQMKVTGAICSPLRVHGYKDAPCQVLGAREK